MSRTQPSGLKQRAAAASVVVKRSLETLLSDANMLDVIAAMTLLLLLLHTEPEKYLRVPVTVLSTAGLLYRPLARKASFWFVVTAVLAAGHFTLWHLIDNHKYLMTYWCLALACSLLMEDPRQALAFNARLLTGLCFFFAVLWKATSPDFLDGSFFHFTLLADPRFQHVTEVVGGVSPAQWAANEKAIASLSRFDSVQTAVQLQDAPRVVAIARFLTGWSMAVEGLVALVFLWPDGPRASRGRDAALLLFLASTYPVATVLGFAWLLAVMGLSQASGFRSSRFLYAVLFVLLPLCDLPFHRIGGFLFRHLSTARGVIGG